MRFSLQHLLVIVWIAGGFVALDVALYGSFEARQGFYVVFIVLMGALLGQYVYYRGWRPPDVPKVWPSLVGIVCLSIFVAGIDFLFGSTAQEICTRSQMTRTLRLFGPIRYGVVSHNKNSMVIRDALKYAPTEHNWKKTADFGWLSAASAPQGYWHPLIVWDAEELRALNSLPAEHIKALMELDSGYDVRFAEFRKRNLYEPLRALFLRDAPESIGASPESTREWYNSHSMFLHLFRSPEDIQNALVAYRKSASWQGRVEHEFIEAMERSGIAVPVRADAGVQKK